MPRSLQRFRAPFTLRPSLFPSPPSLQAHYARVASSNDQPRSPSHLVDALRTFHALEHHFAVPYGFVVPRTSKWPPELHSLPLGVKVHRFMQSFSKRAASGREATEQRKEELHELERLGFPLQAWADYQFQEVCLPALQMYQQQHGNLFVPQKFIVPDATPWPRATRGYKLGLAVANLRKQIQRQRWAEPPPTPPRATPRPVSSPLPQHHVDALNALGFVWHVRDAKWTHYFLPGLQKYKEIEGTVDVPLAFTIPSHATDPRWPKALEGYKLGRHVYMVRSGQYASQVHASRHELAKLGFAFRAQDHVWHHKILPALKVFATHYGHCDVGQDFVIPSQSPWPRASWGLKLGETVKNLRRGAYNAQVQRDRDDLNALGFVWNARHRLETTVRRIVLPALQTYQKLHGHEACVTTDFVVPDRDVQWPVQTRGFRLGPWITRVRSGQIVLSTKLRQKLDQLGFVWRSNDQRWTQVLRPAFQVYATLHGGTCASMSTKFVVPPEKPYPRAAWGVNLGGALWHIRNGDSYVHCREKERELRALGILVDTTGTYGKQLPS